MNSASSDEVRSISDGRAPGKCRFPEEMAADHLSERRFSPDKGALRDALKVVRALDIDSYQALLWALGLTPDSRLSVPGCGQRPSAGEHPAAAADERAGA